MNSLYLLLVFSLCIPFLGYSKSIELNISSTSQYSGGTCSIGATIELPKKPQTNKLIILLSGSGANDRDGSKVNNLYKQVAQHLSSLGISSIRFDKRTSIKECNSQIKDFTDFSPYVFIDDIKNVLDHVKINPITKNFKPVFMGHSQAVNFALEVLVKRGALASSSVVLWAGLGKYDIAETLIRQLGNRSDAINYFKRLRENQVPKNEKFMGAYARFWKEWIDITQLATTTAKQYSGNVLLVQGTNDWNITRGDFNSLCTAFQNTSSVKCKLFDGLDHCLSKSSCKLVDTDALNYIGHWIKNRN